MEQSPPGAAEALDHALGRRDGERDEEPEGEDAHRDEWALEDVLAHALPREEVIEPYPDGEVQADVEEGQETEKAAELDGPGPAEQDAKRGHAETGQEQDEGGEPQGPRDVVDGIGGEIVSEPTAHQDPKRPEAGHPDGGLESDPAAIRHAVLVELLQVHPR